MKQEINIKAYYNDNSERRKIERKKERKKVSDDKQ
jgi:hypothetical protein